MSHWKGTHRGTAPGGVSDLAGLYPRPTLTAENCSMQAFA